MDIPNDYDVVVDVLQKHYDKLWNMTQAQMNSEYGMSLMDDIRFEQMGRLQQAIDMWKARK
jgi:phosphorylcholine metabolism protein LicD